MSVNALIGYSGFVGNTLLKQFSFEELYRSSNIHHIEGKSFDIVVCAGAQAKKWIANKNPQEDLKQIENLINNLKKIKCKQFILVSTVDVFQRPIMVDENSKVDELNLHPYGLNRRILEKFVQYHFPKHLIVRLPGLVGPGLKKNIIFDILNNNNLSSIDSRSVFQFYPMVNLWFDINTSLNAELQLIHLTAEPTSVAEISLFGFGKIFNQILEDEYLSYDMRSIHADKFNKNKYYQYSAREVIQSVRSYAQSEHLTMIPTDRVIK